MPWSAEQYFNTDSTNRSQPEEVADEEIVQRVMEGDVISFELILRRYNQRLFRVARGIIGNDTEAEDIVQETYLSAYQHLGDFAGRSSFSTWLTKIAVHEAAARRRKQHRIWYVDSNKSEMGEMTANSGNHDSPEDNASGTELRGVLTAAIDALPPDLRIIFTLRMVEQLSTEQTAECLDLSPANVKTRLHRARLHLRSWIDDRIGEESRRLFMFDGERCDRIVHAVMARLQGD
jgi:RNA polymerase sigma-70 factor (ECF subfamily)